MCDVCEKAQQDTDHTTYFVAASAARKVVTMIDVFNDLDMEKLATFKQENEARGFDSEITPFGCEEEAGRLYDEITARFAELPDSPRSTSLTRVTLDPIPLA